MNAIAFPCDQPARSTISWTTVLSSGVRCAAPCWPTEVNADGDQLAWALVLGRAETSLSALVNVDGLSASWPRTTSEVAPLCASADSNWSQAVVTVAPAGTCTFTNLRPTGWI